MLSTVVSAAFWIGIAISMANALDLFLLPEQRTRLNAWLESATLNLHYQRPLAWMMGRSEEGRTPAVLLAFAAGMAISVAKTFVEFKHTDTRSVQRWAVAAAAFLVIVLVGALFGLFFVGYVLAGHWLLVRVRRRGISVGKAFLITWAIQIAAVCGFSFFAYRYNLPAWSWSVFQVICVLTVGLPAGGIVYCALFCFVAEKMLAVMRAVMWRIVSNTSGPTKGLTALATCILGIIKLMMAT
jgi:hypothetical protein